MKVFRGPDGTEWKVEVRSPGSSNAMVVFRHPDGRSSHTDRYNWYISRGSEALNVTARLDPARVLNQLSDVEIARLFRRSMPISRVPSALGGAGGSRA
jgi:hypothetical protein